MRSRASARALKQLRGPSPMTSLFFLLPSRCLVTDFVGDGLWTVSLCVSVCVCVFAKTRQLNYPLKIGKTRRVRLYQVLVKRENFGTVGSRW